MTRLAIRHRPGLSPGSVSWPATSASNPNASACFSSSSRSSHSPINVNASSTSSDTSRSTSSGSSQSTSNTPSRLCSRTHTPASSGTSLRSLRNCTRSIFTVDCLATASSSTVESNTRRCLPLTAPVAAIRSRTASKTRSGAPLTRSRLRHNTSTVEWKASSVTANPAAAFHPRSVCNREHASLSERPSNACSTITDATTSPGTDGRPRPDANRSPNIASGNNRVRCRANNACTEPSASRRPHTASASNNSRSITAEPCMTPIIAHPTPEREHPTPINQQSPRVTAVVAARNEIAATMQTIVISVHGKEIEMFSVPARSRESAARPDAANATANPSRVGGAPVLQGAINECCDRRGEALNYGPARKRGFWSCCCRLGVMLSGFLGRRSCWGW